MTFRSKIDWWLVAFVMGTVELGPVSVWISSGAFPAWPALTASAILAVVAVLFVPIRYVIEGRTVVIRCGIPQWEYGAFTVDDIQKVKPTRNPLASAALSLDRLQVHAGMREWLISPKDKRGFLESLARLDAGLEFDGRSLVRRRPMVSARAL